MKINPTNVLHINDNGSNPITRTVFLKMENKCFLLTLLYFHLVPLAAPFEVGAGVGLGIGGGGGVWVGGGIGRTPGTPGSAATTTKLDAAYNALQAWKSTISQDPRGILHSWVGPNVCSYKGVFCSGGDGGATVVGIDLNKANLGGVLVKELALLTDLTLLHLNSNRFSGGVPIAFENLISLQELDLSNNLLAGPFPMATLYMQSLIYLDLRFNNFSGPIPDDLFTRRLDAVLLNDNHFSGELPQTLANSQASVINLANNKLTGSIPASFGFMNSKIKEILLLNNQLTGCIPDGVGLFSDMQVFDVSFNSLAGHLPDTISCLDRIEVLNLAHNRLSGMLPEIVCSLKSLLNLTVAYNFFSGFSQECGNRDNLGFDFSGNCVPNRQLQRPQPECSVPGSSLSCLRMPVVPPIVCSVASALSRGDRTSSSNPP